MYNFPSNDGQSNAVKNDSCRLRLGFPAHMMLCTWLEHTVRLQFKQNRVSKEVKEKRLYCLWIIIFSQNTAEGNMHLKTLRKLLIRLELFQQHIPSVGWSPNQGITYWLFNTLEKYWLFNTFCEEVLEKVLILSAWRSNIWYFFQEFLKVISSKFL